MDLEFSANEVTAIIGPSGCGKSTMVRCINRMHEEIPGARAEGRVLLDDVDVYGPSVDVVAVRRAIGMVFQKPNPFPTMSVYRQRRRRSAADARAPAATSASRSRPRCAAQACGRRSKDRLQQPGAGLSGGQQQRLCIARSLAVDPEVILMDEPCSALDPIATLKIEELIDELKTRVTIVIVTHNMQQAARVADRTAFMLGGELVEVGPTAGDLHDPRRLREPRNMSPESSASDRRRRTARALSMDDDPLTAAELDPATKPAGRVARTSSSSCPSCRSARSAASTSSSSSSTACSRRSIHQDVELAQMVIADDDRLDGRYLEVHQGILSLLALQAPVAGDLRLVAALLARDHAHRADGRSVREHRQADPALGPRAAGAPRGARGAREDGRARALGGRAMSRGVRRARRRTGRGPRAPGSRDQPPQPRDLPHGDRHRRGSRHARVGDAHDRSSPERWSASATTPWTSASRWPSS